MINTHSSCKQSKYYLDCNISGSFPAPVGEVEFLGEHVNQVPELVVWVLLGRYIDRLVGR